MQGDHEKEVKQGVEVEIRTQSFYNTSLFAGFNFVDARSLASGAEIPGIARNTWNLGYIMMTGVLSTGR